MIYWDTYEYCGKFCFREWKKRELLPSEVSRIISLMIGISKNKTSAKTTVFDPTCGLDHYYLKFQMQQKAISLFMVKS